MSLDFKPEEKDVKPFRRRLLVAFGLILTAFSVLVARFAWLQIINQSAYVERAERNRTVSITTQGSRGLIFDRNRTLVAGNVLAYSLEITPDKVKNVNATIDELAKVISITPADRRRFRRLREDLNRYDSIPIRAELTDEEVATFIGQRWRFPGVEINQREYRVYPNGATGSHFIGYIGSISASDQKRLDSEGSLPLYEGARNIGKVGLERSYEALLHGRPGHESLEITAGGHAVRTLDLEAALPGHNLELTVDLNLQRVTEAAMKGKTGAVIAIEPKTGAILAFASLPTYDPNLFPGGIDPDSWSELTQSEEKPLLNRAMRGIYPIGSTYKPFMALAGLESGATTIDYVLNDTGVFSIGKHRFRDMTGAPKGPLSIRKSIAVSSDVYYYWLATQLGVDRIYEFMKPWGFGQKTGIDLVGEQTGILPSRQWKEQRFKEPWYVGDTPSIGVGQGYNAFTLLQLAHATATLANGGVVMRPHLVNATIDPMTGEKTYVAREPVETIPLKRANLDVVVAGMTDVTKTGTARSVFQGAPYSVAGKTGTAQVVTIAQEDKYDEKKLARRHHDHALFIAFAPAKNPKIALAVLVENGGFGAKAAAPVAREVIDYWLTGKNSLGLPPPSGHALIAETKKPSDRRR
ncbi:penicillin-binding protein 2 [Sutterella megalosphaeroides]|uniref:Peptidoglycan D,D-transpeptidase MrdA n=1 Tax=Sutterella megalosphaeroides TaxID=2494234 RepID=A0A2Z6I7C3_9BURK|nr:penicillin-binding protein 2 [Sutterella megalosphaeroides]BBF22293.1 penicillin-binding protein [Sutterella megalosphaeroides]